MPPSLEEVEKDRRAERQAKAAVALFRLGAVGQVWPLLVHGSDPRRSRFSDSLAHSAGQRPWYDKSLPPENREHRSDSIDRRQAAEAEPTKDPNQSSLFDPDTSILRALILIVGHFKGEHLSNDDRAQATRMLLDVYRHDPDPGVHGSARWAIRALGSERGTASNRFRSLAIETRRRQSLVRELGGSDDGPHRRTVAFRMGSPESDPEYHNEIQHWRTIPRRFAIAATEVSIGEFDAFWKQHGSEFPTPQFRKGAKTDPRGGVSWFMATAYCNWLSKRKA